jgi:hypothetical protein
MLTASSRTAAGHNFCEIGHDCTPKIGWDAIAISPKTAIFLRQGRKTETPPMNWRRFFPGGVLLRSILVVAAVECGPVVAIVAAGLSVGVVSTVAGAGAA